MLGVFFRHGSNALLAGAAIVVAGACAAGGGKLRPREIATGAALFFASEYGTHRYLFHAKPARLPFVRRLQHRLHYDHHVEPAKLELLFLPWWYLGPNLAFAGAVYAASTRNRDATASLLLGTLVGLLYYEWVHYVAHVPFRPATPFGRWIRKYHLRHHFMNERLWFGVTNPIVDLAGGSYSGMADAERSATTRLLFPEAFAEALS